MEQLEKFYVNVLIVYMKNMLTFIIFVLMDFTVTFVMMVYLYRINGLETYYFITILNLYQNTIRHIFQKDGELTFLYLR